MRRLMRWLRGDDILRPPRRLVCTCPLETPEDFDRFAMNQHSSRSCPRHEANC